MARNLWSREELLVVLGLYLRTPFGRIHSRNEEIQKLAALIGRTPGSVSMRMCNFAACDPYQQARGIKGLVNGASICQPIWDEYVHDREAVVFESEQCLARFRGVDEEAQPMETERLREVRTRVNQNAFRRIILANYEEKCALTGIDIPGLLVASYIIPWAENTKERMNPENGICLSSLHGTAFNRGLIGITRDFKCVISPKLSQHRAEPYYASHFSGLENSRLRLPLHYEPNPDFLDWHMENVFLHG